MRALAQELGLVQCLFLCAWIQAIHTCSEPKPGRHLHHPIHGQQASQCSPSKRKAHHSWYAVLRIASTEQEASAITADLLCLRKKA